MAKEKLSKKHFNTLKKIRNAEILFITEEMREQCEYLKTQNYINILEVAIVDSTNLDSKQLTIQSTKLIVQITPEGKNYADLHTSWARKMNWDAWLAVFAVILSIITLVLDINKFF